VLNAQVGFDLAFEAFYLGTMNESLAVANAGNGVEDFTAERLVLRLQIE
jgi:hypothetical protein